MSNMVTVSNSTSAELEIKNSKFISVMIPYSLFATTMEQLKVQHPKAVHFVYAYRHLNEQDQIVENQSDDGEPKGSSGKPTLAVLRGKNAINIAIITVRYFGGTKLGVGGLVKAYTEGAQHVISQQEMELFIKQQTNTIEIPYNQFEKVKYILHSFQIKTTQLIYKENSVYIEYTYPVTLAGEIDRRLFDFRRLYVSNQS